MATSVSSSAARIADRMRSFKKGIDADETRRRREDTTIQIRKNRREERLNQRRRMIPMEQSSVISMETAMQTTSTSPDEPMRSLNGVSDLPKIAAMIQSLDPMEQSNAVSKLRRLLSLETNPPIEEVINLGVVPLLVEFLKQHDRPEMQFEAAWALTNIASGTTEHTEVVISCGAVELLCTLLLSPNEDVCEQAVWALGNISGDSPQCRDLVLNAGAMMPLLAVLRRNSGKLTILRNATWTLSNLCRGKPRPEFDLVRPALDLLPHLIHSRDDEVVTDACWTLSYLSDGTTANIQAVIDAGVCSRIVDLVGHTAASIQTPTLRTIGNILTGTNEQTQLMLDLVVLPRLVPLLKHEKKIIRKEACWAISNITAGTPSQIQEVIDANVIPPLLFQLMSVEFDVRKEAAWAISNATSGGSTEQIKYLVQQGCIPPLVKLLDVQDPRVINVSLDALENILQAGEADTSLTDTENRMARYIEEADGIELIQNLQFHQEEDIYEKSVRIIRDYFDGEDEEDFDIAPDMDYGAHQFSFGVGEAASADGGNIRFNF
ncbi:Importin subunit alpha-1b [Phytophthora cactorum]|uniref:Importin subunit alpha n=1 Tax=Phytophthora cactorum TaxID=29920 RepID=A0A8T0Z9W6_9STRA|nr:Importin subunit alpha-1b [Phytophthora cactorum]KAG2858991.1 Importin subunit alpha-1b [Phytophthora cactorum]KAG2910494.1 Importin subunit alpha-1b [Phytophthora cactorum]KAG2925653.1 Importin subunit alpha-1b [Phytophthora cactorum]KAG2942809.1 Importin subunit alpha-1b [Phytophthora cactorum]